MSRIKISLLTPENVGEFINICSTYDFDINVYDGRNVLDGKSIIAIFSIECGKCIEVEPITDEESVKKNFIEKIKKFEV